MLALTLADLRFRARQFLITTAGVGLVLGIALVLSGMVNGFQTEINTTVAAVGATHWVLSDASEGRFTSFAAFPQTVASTVAAEPGVGRVDPLLVLPLQVAKVAGSQVTYNLFGVVRGGLGDPAAVSAGHRLLAPGQAVADVRLHVGVGAVIVLGGRPFTVVGTVSNRTLIAGIPLVYTALADAQVVALNGRPLVTAVVTTGVPRTVPPGFETRTPDQIDTSAGTQLAGGRSSIESTRSLMWIIAVFIVGAMLYVAALDRQRDFAVLKALGSSSSALFSSLVLEAVVVTLAAAALATGIGTLLAPKFPQPIDITTGAYLSLPLIAVVVGVLASTAALRKATGADPAAAFS